MQTEIKEISSVEYELTLHVPPKNCNPNWTACYASSVPVFSSKGFVPVRHRCRW